MQRSAKSLASSIDTQWGLLQCVHMLPRSGLLEHGIAADGFRPPLNLGVELNR